MKRTPMKRTTALRAAKLQKAGQGVLRATTIKPSGKRLAQRRSTGKPTVAQVARWDRMREIGCVACYLNRSEGRPSATFGKQNLEIHHLLSGGRRIGHDATICLCHFHHQGKRLPFTTHSYTEQASIFGPSLEREPRRWRGVYGRDEELLELQERLLARAKP